jgi:ABC-type transport system involved in cytochrome c biogenesis ATPase subunit
MRNGAGKTTMVRILSTLTPATAGQVRVRAMTCVPRRTRCGRRSASRPVRGQARTWVQDKWAALSDLEFQRLYRAYHEAFDWDPADARVGSIADALIDFSERHREELQSQHADPE